MLEQLLTTPELEHRLVLLAADAIVDRVSCPATVVPTPDLPRVRLVALVPPMVRPAAELASKLEPWIVPDVVRLPAVVTVSWLDEPTDRRAVPENVELPIWTLPVPLS